MTTPAFRPLPPGEFAPWFIARSLANPHYHFSSVAGRHVLLFFPGTLAEPSSQAMLHSLLSHADLFDDLRCSLFVVACDARDVQEQRVRDRIPGIRVFCDDEAGIAKLFGVVRRADGGQAQVHPSLVLLSPTLQVMRWWVPGADGADPAVAACAAVATIPMPLRGPAQVQAPVIVVPQVFEPAFCRELIAYYERTGGEDSGYMRKDPDGIRGVIDYSVKRRMDCLIEDEKLRKACAARVQRRLLPEIARVFRFKVTRMERYLVACYDAQVGGYFRPHRDNDGEGHRQFAVTLNLNAEEYEGGDLCFTEYGRQTYRAPTGGACVFSCGLMHEATPVTRGKRYAFVPFLYDEASATQREKNSAKYVDPKHHYRLKPEESA